jgi:hypothetical protein
MVNKVEHSYSDYARVDASIYDGSSDEVPALVPSKTLDQAFPAKLHYILNEVEKDGLSSIVSWQIHGRCFVVRDHARFVKEILPRFV